MPSGPPTAGRQRTHLVVAGVLAIALALTFTLLLTSSLDQGARATTSAVGLLLTGLLATSSSAVRARWSTGGRRRAWRLLALAGLVAISGNVLGAALDSGPALGLPFAPSDVAIALALMTSIASLTYFTQVTRSRVDLAVMALDGLILGSAVLMIAATVVYDQLKADVGADEVLSRVVIPLLDVVLATVALILLRRTRGPDRFALGLVAAGFIVYTMTDLGYAVRQAEDGTFAFGTPLDLGWMVGYLLLALAAWWPTGTREVPREEGVAGAEDWDTAVVFGVLLVAVMVEVTGEGGEGLFSIEAALWLFLIGGAGLRQGLIARDNRHLRRNLEDDVRERTADLRQMGRETEVLLSSVADGIYGVDTEGRVTFVNPSGATMLGYAVEDLTGRPAHELFHAPAEDGIPFPAADCYIAEAVRERVVSNGEEDLYVRADGGTFPVEITASPLVDTETGEVRGGVVVFRDVTQRREVDRMKNEFLSVVSHELRTPLTSIRGSLGLLAGGVLGELPEPAGAMVNRALMSSERLTRMINDILDLERIESGSLALEVLPHDVDDLLAIADREMAGLAASREVRLVRTAGCPARVLADHDRIVQSLTNLIGNAVKFSDPGSVVELGAVQDGDSIVMRVRDHGRGIPADRMESIFDRFEQVDSSDIRQQGGSGLGLAICRGIVERHGGRVWLESELGVGTTASLSLQAAPAASHAGDAATA
ncbi:PAS domain-containing sensor histidine kinase [Nocardioides sp. AX2bis]|uniref:PAS domain-containing sensor histidine kinase n=1 Tax=Nocardioides sp. AX2bis TaxID=2653157 RepID=UPI0012F3ABDB|nr:ATP-binding protein [Nocardioides sp. AX2bis]VXC16911.1 Sensor protein kinase WalK [Nocardioides sp. AX2bis]